MERNLVLEPETVVQLTDIVTEVARRLEGVSSAGANKDFLACRIIRLYGLGITDPNALRQKLWEQAAKPDKTSAVPKAKQAYERAMKAIHRHRLVIAALNRRNFSTEEAEKALAVLMEQAETLQAHYQEVSLSTQKSPTYAERKAVCDTAARTIIQAQKVTHDIKTARLRQARLTMKEATETPKEGKPSGLVTLKSRE